MFILWLCLFLYLGLTLLKCISKHLESPHMFDIILTIYFWLLISASVLVSFPILIVASFFVNQKTFAYLYEQINNNIIYYGMTIPGIWSVNIRYLSDKYEDGQYVIVANHASYVDSFFISLVPFTKKFMMALAYSKIPLFGWLCTKAGFVLVAQEDPSTTRNAVNDAVSRLDDGSSFMLYPEGRRQPVPNVLLQFKTGAYRIAQKAGVKILPVALKNTSKAMTYSGICSFAHVELIIGVPIDVCKINSNTNDSYDWDEINDAIKETRAFMNKYIS